MAIYHVTDFYSTILTNPLQCIRCLIHSGKKARYLGLCLFEFTAHRYYNGQLAQFECFGRKSMESWKGK